MEIINQIIGFIKNLFDFWFVIMPWEQAVFVRAGSRVRILNNGFYFKLPFLDKVFIQSKRMRMIDVPIQTISTKDNKTVTIRSCISYSIDDIYKLYNTIAQPEMTLSGIVMSNIAQYMRSVDSTTASALAAEKYVNQKLNNESFGLKDVSIKVTSWCEVKTFRLIQDASWMGEGLTMN